MQMVTPCIGMQVKMFTATGWEMIEDAGQPPVVKSGGGTGQEGSPELKIVRKNEFDHTTMTMSVVVEFPGAEFHVFCKVTSSIPGRDHETFYVDHFFFFFLLPSPPQYFTSRSDFWAWARVPKVAVKYFSGDNRDV